MDFLWHARDREAALLAELLRASRLTVLYGEVGSGKTTLLKTGVLPLLRRRVSDRDLSEGGKSRVVIPFPERRSRNNPAGGDLEVVFFFDAWNEVRLTSLHARMLNGLPIGRTRMAAPSRPFAESLAAWNKELGVRFLIIFDRFEEYLAAPLDREGVREFADEFARAVNDPLLPANFLVSLREEATLLARFQERIPGLGDASLRLPALHRSTAPPLKEPQPADLHRTAIAIAPSLAHPEQPEEQPEAIRADPPSPEIPAEPGNITRAGWRSKLRWLAIPVGATALLLIVWAKLEPPAEREATQVAEQAAGKEEAMPLSENVVPRLAAASTLPKVELVIDPGDAMDKRAAQDLARFIAPDAGLELVVRADGQPGPSEGPAPQLAIVRYDELRAARTGEGPAAKVSDRLRIVTPLYTEEIYVIARTDSPLAFIHDIRGAKINLGPARSSRGLTAALLYERMFGAPIPAADASFLGDEEALRKLVTDKTIDAMVVVAAQPVKWLADLTPRMSQPIKLLKLDREHPTSSSAVDAYLPAIVPAGSYGTWPLEDVPTLAVMSFLVTSEATDEAAVERLGMFAQSFCRNLPVLRREGHPKWREVQPGFQLDAGWPYSAPAQAAFDSCRSSSPAGGSVASNHPPIVKGARR